MSFTAQYVFPNKLQPKIHSPEIDAEKLLEQDRAGKGGEEQKEKVGGRRERRYRMEGKEDGRREKGVGPRREAEREEKGKKISFYGLYSSQNTIKKN